jgi:phosphate transport system permease protein
MASTTATTQPPAPAASAGAAREGLWSDRLVERTLRVVSCLVLAVIAGMVAFVVVRAWPSFQANGLAWFGSGGNVDQQLQDIFNSPANPDAYEYEIRTWPLLWGTALTTIGGVGLGLVLAVLTAIFIVEFAPRPLQRILEPTVRLLAAVPSVIFGLIGILVLVPWVGDHLISEERKASVAYVIQLTGASVSVAVVILCMMVTPIMIAIIVDALRAVPSTWMEGAAALGANRWRVMLTVAVRASRPAIIAAAVLATARALGEAIMLSMVSGSTGFAPNPLDGLTFFLEPTRPLAATIVDNREGLSIEPFGQTIYAFAAVLLVSSMALSWIGWAAKQPLRRYGVQG